MEYLAEDPTYLAGGLGVLAVAFLIALKVTQQGKYLIWAGAALALAGVVLVVERLWVTDNERIEQVVYDLRRAVAASDADGVIQLLTPDVTYAPGENVRYLRGTRLRGVATRAFIRTTLPGCKFDFVRVTQLKAHAGEQSRQGTARFRVIAGGSFTTPGGQQYNYGTTGESAGSAWELGLRETGPKVWKVERISPMQVPREADAVLPAGGGSPAPSLPIKLPGASR